jgi:putative DNA primase/helicase
MSDNDDVEIARLAALSPLDYERERETAAKRLGCRPAILDRLVETKRGSGAPGAGGSGRALAIPEIVPWPEPVNGPTLLDEIAATIRRHVVVDATAAEAAALWVVHTHALEAAYVSPRFAITSPEKRCGKTTLLTLLGALAARPLATANLTAAVLFRVIEAIQPTLLIDEADTFIGGADTMRGIINAGHSRGTATVLRSAPDSKDGWEPRSFKVWGPLALAAIGQLPGTIEDRSIKVAMRRRRADELVEPLRIDRLDRLGPLARRVARWASDQKVALSAADPAVPAELHDRAADNWRPLLAIADVAGGEWPERARRAAVVLTRNNGGPDETELSGFFC